MKHAKPSAWLVRPYEASTWAVVLEPPTDETRRFMEFIPLYTIEALGLEVEE